MKRKHATNWFRFALKLGLLATDAAVWSSVNRMLSDREEGSARLRENVSDDLGHRRGRSHFWTLLTGAAIGVGVGMLLAPTSGEEIRSTLLDKANDVRDKWNDMTAWAGGFGSSQRSERRTGTYAE